MSMIQSSPIEIAAKSQSRLFTLYVVVLVVGGLAAAFVTVLVYRASNAYQEAVKADAETRLKVETEKVRTGAANEAKRIESEAKNRLEIETKRIEGEAGKKIEDARAEADVKVERARAETGVKIEAARVDADTKIANAQRETEELRKQNLATELSLEEEKYKRLNLARSLSRRVIPHIRVIGGKSNFDGIKPFAGMQAIIEFAPDHEPSRAAEELVGALHASGWLILSVLPNQEMLNPFWDGVTISSYLPRIAPGLPPNEAMGLMRARERPREAENALLKLLETNNWKARGFPADPDRVPPNTVLIRIGLKPEPMFTTEAEDEFSRATAQEAEPLPLKRAEARHVTQDQRTVITGGVS